MTRQFPCSIATLGGQREARTTAKSLGSQLILWILLIFLAPVPGKSQLVESLEHNDASVSGQSLIQLDADTFVLAYQGADLDGFVKTFTVSADGATITEVQSLEHDTGQVENNSLVQLDADTVVLAYRSGGSDGTLKTFDISADGSTITQIQSVPFETMGSVFRTSLVRVDLDTVVLAYNATTIGGTLKTFDVSADGTTITEVQSLVHDPRTAQDGSLVWLNGDTYALAFRSLTAGSRGAIKTFTVSSDGTTITQVQLLQHLDNFALNNTMIRWDADTVVLAYRDVSSDGWLKTFDIPAGGATITEVEALQYAPAFVSTMVPLDADTMAIVHRGSGGADDSLRTFDIPADGSSITPVQVLPTAAAASLSMARVDGDIYALARGDAGSGFLDTYGITTSGILVDLAITKTDGITSATPGVTRLVYTIVATNNGASEAPSVSLTDPFPAGLSCTYTSVAAGGATGNTLAGSGDLAETLVMPAGSAVTYTATCAIAVSAMGTLSNTASISGSLTDLTPGNNSATDDDTVLAPVADLAITKSDGVTSAVPGQTVIYTIVASHNGGSTEPSVSVTDTFPAALGCTTTSVAAGGATGNTAAGSGDLAETLSMPSGSSVTYTATCTIDAGATGTLSNTAAISGTLTDPVSANNSATDADTVLSPQADLVITKTDGVTTAVPGQTTLTYTIVASNAGPSDDPTVSVTDTFPADLTCTYTSVAAGGATGNTGAGAGDLAETLSLPSGSSVTYTATCAIDPAATGSLSNTAAISGSLTDPVPGNNSATDSDTVLAPEADLSITKTDGVTSAVPGQSVTYTLVASNAGPSDDSAVSVTDTFPAELTCTYTSVAAGGATGSTAAGSGDLAETLSLPSGSSVTYTATCAIDSDATGTLSNTATIAGTATDPTPGNNSATDADTVLGSEADLAITKTDGVTSAEPGELLTYTIVATNLGPSTASSATVIDAFPAALTNVTWVCAATAGSSCVASGTGDINVVGSLAAGGSLTFTAEGTVDPAFAGVLTNSSSVEAGAGVTDPDASNNQAVDVTTVSSSAELTATKSVSGEFYEGGTVHYLITLLNLGPMAQLDNPGDELIDELPSDLRLIGAVATAGTATVDLAQNLVTWNGGIAADGVVEIEIEAVIQLGAAGQTISNQGTVFFDADGNGTNESSVGTDDPDIAGGDDATRFQVLTTVEIPTLGDWSLCFLALLLAASAIHHARRLSRGTV